MEIEEDPESPDWVFEPIREPATPIIEPEPVKSEPVPV